MTSAYRKTNDKTKIGQKKEPISYFYFENEDIDSIYEEDHFLHRNWDQTCEIFYLEKGKIELLNNEQVLELHEEEFCFIDTENLRQIQSIEPRSKLHIIRFDPNLFDSVYDDLFQEQIIHPYLTGTIGFPKIIKEDRLSYDLVDTIVKNIIKVFSKRSPFAYYETKLALYTLFLTFFELNLFVEKKQTGEEVEEIKQYKKAIEYIESHYQDEIHLNELADHIACSQAHLNKIFNDYQNDSPIHFLIEYRIEKACQYLKQTKLPVAEISRLSGFFNVSYFIRQFKDFKKMTPLKYRKSFL